MSASTLPSPATTTAAALRFPPYFSLLEGSLYAVWLSRFFWPMALTATAQSALPREPTWEDVIVPALRKRESPFPHTESRV